jgi:hypothetical protein
MRNVVNGTCDQEQRADSRQQNDCLKLVEYMLEFGPTTLPRNSIASSMQTALQGNGILPPGGIREPQLRVAPGLRMKICHPHEVHVVSRTMSALLEIYMYIYIYIYIYIYYKASCSPSPS